MGFFVSRVGRHRGHIAGSPLPNLVLEPLRIPFWTFQHIALGPSLSSAVAHLLTSIGHSGMVSSAGSVPRRISKHKGADSGQCPPRSHLARYHLQRINCSEGRVNMATKFGVAFAFAAYATCAISGERITVGPLEQATGKPAMGVKKAEAVTVSGPLKVVPMQGAVLTLQSTNMGQIVLFSPMDVEPVMEQKLRSIESSGVSVKVSGTLNTMCSDQQLKAETVGCRRFDLTKPIVVEKP